MRISDWSSDVCSSDLHEGVAGAAQFRTLAEIHARLLDREARLVEAAGDRVELDPEGGHRPAMDHVGGGGDEADRHADGQHDAIVGRSEEHTSELQSLMCISYAVFCLKKKIKITKSK